MRVLLTGNCGYIGVVLAPMLERAGHEVVGLDSDLFEHCDFGQAPKSFQSCGKPVSRSHAGRTQGRTPFLPLDEDARCRYAHVR